MEVYATIAVLVCVLNHLLDLSLGKSLANAFADLGELLDSEGALAVLIEDFEQLLQAGLGLAVPVEAEDLQKGLEIHLSVRGLSLDDMQDFAGLLLQAQSLDGRGQFLGGNVAALIIVKDIEAFLEPDHIIHRQVLGGVDTGIEGRLLGKR